VLASHLRQAGLQVIPGLLPPEVVGLDYGSLEEITLEEYAARVLARIGSAALEALGSGAGWLVDYSELPAAAFEGVAAHFGLSFTERERAAAAEAAKRDAKTPGVLFEPDSERKRREITRAGREQADRWLRPVYEQLDAARLQRVAC